MLEGNLVADIFDYPFEAMRSLEHYHWHSGIFSNHKMAALKNNVVSNAYHAGFTFILQDKKDTASGGHTIANNEAVANYRYGAVIAAEDKGMELFEFQAWSNGQCICVVCLLRLRSELFNRGLPGKPEPHKPILFPGRAGIVDIEETSSSVQLRRVELADNMMGIAFHFLGAGSQNQQLKVLQSIVIGSSIATSAEEGDCVAKVDSCLTHP